MRRGATIFALGTAAAVAGTAALSGGALVGAVGGTGRDGQARAAESTGAVLSGRPSATDSLPRFDSCAQLRQWYLRAAGRVGPWGPHGSPGVVVPPRAPVASAVQAQGVTSGADTAVGTSPTGTNVQEAGVDESDVAKTNGHLLVRLSGRRLVVTDVSGERPRELSRTTLPGPLTGAELLLDGDRVTVVGSSGATGIMHPGIAVPPGLAESVPAVPLAQDGVGPGRVLPPVRWGPVRTRMLSVDISDPSHPRVTSDRGVDGQVVSSRDYTDGTVRVVVRSTPMLRFMEPGRGMTPDRATATDRQVLRDAPASAWVPALGETAHGHPLLTCGDVRHPRLPSGLGTVTVLSFDAATPGTVEATAVATGGDLVYSSADRLYVTTTHGSTSTVHVFALDGTHTSYLGSGRLPGTVRDRWSMSEYDGHLRVATAVGRDPWRPRENAVVVLDERGGRLVQTGRVDGIGSGEQIQAVRWLGDLAVLVTFRQTDPVWTVDLSDATHPRVLGRLDIPGFSAYLHPVGNGLLVGLGRDATARGTDRGAQAATFDVGDPSSPRRVATLAFGRDTALGAASDPREVTYLPDDRTLVTPLEAWAGSGRSRFVALHVGTDGSLTATGSWPTAPGPAVEVWPATGSEPRALPLGGSRVALVDDHVRIVTLG